MRRGGYRKWRKIEIKLENFRSYENETVINFNNLDVFVGKNDIGNIYHSRGFGYIFFNEGKCVIKIEQDDVNKKYLSKLIILQILSAGIKLRML